MPIIVTDYITTTSPSDTYATHSSELGLGGYREVADVPARDAITEERRSVGMLVFTIAEQKLWQLTEVVSNTYVEVLLLRGTITNPTTGNVLKYNNLTSTWENGVPDTFTLGDATDVVITSPESGQVLVYNSVSNNWENGTQTLSFLSDVDFQTVPSNGQVLAFNGTTWFNKDVPQFNVLTPSDGEVLIYSLGTWNNASLPVPSLSDLTDTSISLTPTNGNYLRYDANTSTWVDQAADAITVNDVGGIVLTVPQAGEVLTYSGSNWVNQAIPVQDKSMPDLLDVNFPVNPAEGDILRYRTGTWTNEPLIELNVSVPTVGQYLRYNDATLKWENQAADTVALNNLTNVNIAPTPANGDALIYNSISGNWENAPPVDPNPPTVEDLSDVVYWSALAPSQVLTYDGDNWTNQDFISINAVDPVDGEILAYNDQTLEWENRRFESLSSAVVQNGHGFSVGQILRHNGTAYALAQADTEANSRVVGIVTTVVDPNTFVYTHSGVVTDLLGLTAGSAYYLDDTTAGAFTSTPPSSIQQPVFVATSATTAVFFISIAASTSVIDGGEIV